MSLLPFLTYLRLKIFAITIRAFVRLVHEGGRPPRAHPDEVLHIPSRDRDSGRTIKVHIYHSQSTSASGSGSGSKLKPVLINFHGSGFVIPMHGSDDEFCRQMSRETEYTVLDVQYRLAPEHPFPAALHDAEDVVRWVLEHSEEFDPERIAVSGFSAGANLALVLSSSSFPKGTFRSVLAFYPPTDISIEPGSKVPPDTDPAGKPIPAFVARLFNCCYIPPGFDARDPRISPSFAPAEAFSDNVLIVTAARDSLAREAEALATKIEGAGGPGRNVVCRRMEKCNHAWDKEANKEGTVQEKAKKDAYALAVEMLQR